MKTSLGKWFSLACLCLALLGFPLTLGACGFTGKIDMGTPAPIGTSSRNPYIISATQGNCTAWTLILDGVGGKPWCASTVPVLHPGDYVQLSYGVLSQDFKVTAIAPAQHLVSLGKM